MTAHHTRPLLPRLTARSVVRGADDPYAALRLCWQDFATIDAAITSAPAELAGVPQHCACDIAEHTRDERVLQMACNDLRLTVRQAAARNTLRSPARDPLEVIAASTTPAQAIRELLAAGHTVDAAAARALVELGETSNADQYIAETWPLITAGQLTVDAMRVWYEHPSTAGYATGLMRNGRTPLGWLAEFGVKYGLSTLNARAEAGPRDGLTDEIEAAIAHTVASGWTSDQLNTITDSLAGLPLSVDARAGLLVACDLIAAAVRYLRRPEWFGSAFEALEERLIANAHSTDMVDAVMRLLSNPESQPGGSRSVARVLARHSSHAARYIATQNTTGAICDGYADALWDAAGGDIEQAATIVELSRDKLSIADAAAIAARLGPDSAPDTTPDTQTHAEPDIRAGRAENSCDGNSQQ